MLRVNFVNMGKLNLVSDLAEQLRRIDVFPVDIPNFNLRGKYKVPSICGGLLTVAIVTVLTLYGLLKFQIML